MSKMHVLGVKLTTDPTSNKIAYIRDGKTFVRSGSDDYKVGTPLQGASDHLFTRFGYRKVDASVVFRDGEEMRENASRFAPAPKGKAIYQ